MSSYSGNVIIRGSKKEARRLKTLVADRLIQGFPGYLRLDRVYLKESSKDCLVNNTDNPKIEFNFKAELELLNDTYKIVSRTEEVKILKLSAKAGENRLLSGVVVLPHGSDITDFKLKYSNNFSKNIGLPIDFFHGRIFKEGTQELDEYRQELHQRTLKEQQNREAKQNIVFSEIHFESMLNEQRVQIAKKRVANVKIQRQEQERLRKRWEELKLAEDIATDKWEFQKSEAARKDKENELKRLENDFIL